MNFLNAFCKVYLAAVPISAISVAIHEYSKVPTYFSNHYISNKEHLYHSFKEGFSMGMITASAPIIFQILFCHYLFYQIKFYYLLK